MHQKHLLNSLTLLAAIFFFAGCAGMLQRPVTHTPPNQEEFGKKYSAQELNSDLKMLNDNLGISQIKSTRATYNDDVIPLLAKGEFVNWMAWTNAVQSPDPRLDLLAWFATGSSYNFNRASNADLDKALSGSLTEPDVNKAKQLSLQAQDIILKNAQFGTIVLYNYISRTATWNYLHANFKTPATAGKPAAGFWNTAAGALTGKNTWFNTKDPTYADSLKNRTLS